MVEQRLEIAGERVVVGAGRRLARAPEAAPVAADAAMAGGQQRTLLTLPRVAVQWIAVDGIAVSFLVRDLRGPLRGLELDRARARHKPRV
jgi:hypothetical protein